MNASQTHRSTSGYAVRALLLVLCLWQIGCAGSDETTAEKPAKLPPEMALLRSDITLLPMGGINSSSDDFGIAASLDTSMLFFTSSRAGSRGKHSIFWSRKNVGGWSEPTLAVEVNNEHSNGAPSISPGGQTLYFTGCDYGFGDCDLYGVQAGIRGSVPGPAVPWGIPINLGLYINSPFWDSQPCLAPDGSVMYFSSDRPGGYGGRDIWVCLRKQDGSWSIPINAGEAINTVFDEVTPVITPDLRTLFFASNGHPGIGGFDMFFVELDPTDVMYPLTPAYNVGRPINSTSDDIGLAISPDGARAYIASNRSGGKGGYDLYQLNTPPIDIEPVSVVRGTVRDEEGRPMLAEISVANLANGNVIGQYQTNPETGVYTAVVRSVGAYSITAQAPNRLFHSRQITIYEQKADQTFELEHRLNPLDGRVVLLLFFEPGSSVLRKESTGDLDRVAAFLKAFPDLTIEIGGHTDNTGDRKSNEDLSLERAESVKAYLIGNRIDGDRIEVKGYGQSAPIGDNGTEEGREMNRRVEMRVLK